MNAILNDGALIIGKKNINFHKFKAIFAYLIIIVVWLLKVRGCSLMK